MRIDKQYLTQAEEDKALLRRMDEGKKKGRMTEKEQEHFMNWLRNSSSALG